MKMNATTENKATLETARRAVIDGLTRSDRKVDTRPEIKQLDEASVRRTTFRSVGIVVMVF
jgi:hypothetical protein